MIENLYTAGGPESGVMITPGQINDQMMNDWERYFSTAVPGQSINWGGGTLTMGQDGQAVYKAPNATNGGTVINPLSIGNTAYLQSLAASNPGIAKQWGDQYGYTSGMNAQDQAVFNRGITQTSPIGQSGGDPFAVQQSATVQQPVQQPVQQANPIQPGTPSPWTPPAQNQPQIYPQNEYQMPVLNALYQAQQQRMSAPAPQFNFQSQGPLTTSAPQSQDGPATGALTTVINGS